MLLEICANSYQSAKNAQDAGAHRIELCQKLDVGGITPSIDVFKKVRKELQIPIYVLIRPRAGDFYYSDGEIELMLTQIETFKTLGADGIVCGALNEKKDLNLEQTRLLIEKTKPLPFTFHRAFDDVNNPLKTLETLTTLGVHRILTSGQESVAEKGIELLKQLNNKANGKITIMPGSGINPNNANLFKEAGFNEIHGSASRLVNGQKISDLTTIKAILNEI